MSDLIARYGLDHSQFSAGMRRVSQEAHQGSEKVSGHFEEMGRHAAKHVLKTFGVFKLAKQLVHASKDAVKEYAEEFEFASQATNHLKEAVEGLKHDLARDLFAGPVGGISDMVEALREARTEAVDFLAAVMDNPMNISAGREHGVEVDKSIKEAEGEVKKARNRKAFEETSSEMLEENFRLSGDIDKAEEEAESRKHRQKIEHLKEQAKSAKWTFEQAEFFSKAEDWRHRRRLKQIGEERDERNLKELMDQTQEIDRKNREAAERAKEAKRAEDDHRNTTGGLNNAAAEARIDALRLDGREKEAAILKLQLDLKKQMAEIDAEASLSDQEKAFYKRQALDAEKDLERATGDKFDRDEEEKNRKRGNARSMTLGAGLFASSMAGNLLFPGNVGQTPEKHLKVAEKTQKSVEEMKGLVNLVQRQIGDLVTTLKE